MSRRKWDFEYPPYPMPPYHHQMLSVEQAMEAKLWWEHIEKSLKKEDKKDVSKHPLHGTMNMLQVFLLLVGTSPFVAIIYKVLIIPQLLK